MRLETLAVLWLCSGCSAAPDGDPLASMTGIVFDPGSTSGGGSESSTSDGESTTAVVDDSSTSSGAATEESTSGVDPVGGICSPIESDAPCTACTKANCCAQLMACSSDEACGCYMTCVATSADVFGCGTQCGVDLFAPGPVGDLVACSSGPCGAACV